jgi:hypothetical protein
MANLMELLERGLLQSPRSQIEKLYINAGRVPGAQGVDPATGFFTGVDGKILSVRNPETGKFGPVKAIEAPVSTAKAIPASERYLQEQLDRWSGEGGASGAERPAPSTSLTRVEPEARPDSNFVMRPEGPTDVVPWTGSTAVVPSAGEAATNRALAIADQANIAGGLPMRLPPEAGGNMASSPWAKRAAWGAVGAGALGAANLPLGGSNAPSAPAGGGGNAPSAPLGTPNMPPGNLPTFARGNTPPLDLSFLATKESTPTTAIPTPPHRPAESSLSPAREPARTPAPSILDRIFSSKNYQSTGPGGHGYEAPVQEQQGGKDVINWGDPNSMADFVRASKALQADPNAIGAGSSADTGMARGGAAKASGKGGHDAIHKALEIIHHLIGGQYSHG